MTCNSPQQPSVLAQKEKIWRTKGKMCFRKGGLTLTNETPVSYKKIDEVPAEMLALTPTISTCVTIPPPLK